MITDNDIYPFFPSIYFPRDGHGNSAPDDPLTIHLSFETDSGTSTYKLSLRDAVEMDLKSIRGGSYMDGAKIIRDGLIALADELTRALDEGAAAS